MKSHRRLPMVQQLQTFPICSRCHAIGYPQDRYCSRCGAFLRPMPVAQNECPICGATRRHPVEFHCTQCGAMLPASRQRDT